MRRISVVTIVSFWLGMGLAQAQTEPVDKNLSGVYVGGQLVLGQSFKAGTGSPGAAALVGVDLGYGIKRDTWNRIELGMEISTGQASYSEDSRLGDTQVNLDLNMVALFKAGYSYSIGDHAFSTFRIGIGAVQADYSTEIADQTYTDKGTGVASMIGWDAFYPANDTLDLLAGASYRIYNLKFKDQDNMQLSFPGLYVGARVRL